MESGVTATGTPGAPFLDFYDAALPQVYGYLSMRCGPRAVVEDLTAETFMAAVAAVREDEATPVSVGWVIGIARHKLVDHWRRQGRSERHLHALADDRPAPNDPWDAELDSLLVRRILDSISPDHRAALTLRYLDDLPVPSVAAHLSRSVHATEALLARARGAFRRAYVEQEEPSDG
jgi:RNA polymerase sigma-70 factor (ECF subfamily)